MKHKHEDYKLSAVKYYFYRNFKYPAYSSKGTVYSTIANTFNSKLQLFIKHGKKCNPKV